SLPPGVDGAALHAAALEQGIEYARGDLFSLDGSTIDRALLSFAQMGRPKIAQGIERLADLVRRERKRSRESA
ncbi:MAG: hypothetical protein HKP30_08715, partial [Myxococcales bacterium]|nr:hypothetical protein [Myxococcales bacterium]